MVDCDILIAGAGLAGLALAVELAAPEFSHLKICLMEPRRSYERDRTWSYWRVEPHRYQSLEVARWHQWRVSGPQAVALCESQTPYCTIPADAFYRHALAVIGAAAHIRQRWGVGVSSIEPGEWPRVQLSDNSSMRARLVFDARAVQPNVDTQYFQRFSGLEFVADRDCFDSSVMDLMHFQEVDQGVHFFYVLPYSARTALVESTWISTQSASTDEAARIAAYCQARWPAARLQPTFAEHGCLPLETRATCRHAKSRVVPLGTRAGTCRAATGYAFLDTVQDARRIADEIRLGGIELEPPKPFQRPRLERWMDRVFLKTLFQQKDQGHQLFLRMFGRCPADVLLRFLSGRYSMADRITVMASLPPLPFIRSALGV